MTAATFVAGMAGGLLGLAIGWRVATVGARTTVKYWREVCQGLDNELAAVRVELAKADQANDELGESVDRAFRLGLREGQLFRADREAEGL